MEEKMRTATMAARDEDLEDDEEKRALDAFAEEILQVVDQDVDFFVQTEGSDDDEEENGMSFEAQLARLNTQTGRELEETLRRIERQLLGIEMPGDEGAGKGSDDEDDDPYAYVRDGVSHSMTQPASVEEWRTAYPELCKPGTELFILGRAYPKGSPTLPSDDQASESFKDEAVSLSDGAPKDPKDGGPKD